MNKNNFDTIIIGAGPAGCSAAYFLAKRNQKVLLIDKEKFPREKICGDGLTPPALFMLEKIGILGEIKNNNPLRINYVTLSSPDSILIKGKTPRVNNYRDYGYTMPRKKFLINTVIKRNSKNQKKADVMAGVIHHVLPKKRLFYNF